MIEIKRAGEVCVLMLRREVTKQLGKPVTTFEQAEPEHVVQAVTAGDPRIVGRLNELGWRKVPTYAESLVASLDNVAPPDVMAERGQLQEEINYSRIWHLKSRDVLPDEIDEDPPQGVRGDAAIELLADMRTELRELIVQELDSDFGDDCEASPAAVRARVCDLKDRSDDLQLSADEALKQCGRETVARIKAERQLEIERREMLISVEQERERLRPSFDPSKIGVTVEEAMAGFASFPKLGTLPERELSLGERVGNKIVGGVFWLLDHVP